MNEDSTHSALNTALLAGFLMHRGNKFAMPRTVKRGFGSSICVMDWLAAVTSFKGVKICAIGDDVHVIICFNNGGFSESFMMISCALDAADAAKLQSQLSGALQSLNTCLKQSGGAS